ncbi:MAG: Glutathione S-transferase, N-terminal domain protein [Polaromonas sp.]|nr:Glutathione S-transferase, N-terminal domain protein [Polaromonas sp.]
MPVSFKPPSDVAHQCRPILYSFRRCPYAIRARLAMTASHQACELREVALRSKPAELLAASGKSTVPVLVLPSGQVIDQSLDIMIWALMQNDPQGWLGPDVEALQAMRVLIGQNDGKFKQHLDRYKYPNRHLAEHAGNEQAFAQLHRSCASAWLSTLEILLARQAWLLGKSACLADMAILPFVRQFAHTDMAWFGTQPWPHLQAWLMNWESSRLFAMVMEKYAPWQSGQPGIAFAFSVAAAPGQYG